jgi:hypothetical protein
MSEIGRCGLAGADVSTIAAAAGVAPGRHRVVRRRTRDGRPIERLYSEVLTDEVGHVGYCAARCTPTERTLMRRLYPRFARLFARQTLEISLLTDREKLGLPNATFLAAHP